MGRRLLALTAFVIVLAGCGSTTPTHGISLRIDKSPFHVTLLNDGKVVVGEDADSRLRYRLVSGAEHKLTKLISSTVVDSAGPGGPVTQYRVATDEPGRTADVVAAKRPDGVIIGVTLNPATGVSEVYDSFDTQPGVHFLGGGERGGAVDLRGQVLSVKVSTACSYAPVPYFASTAGWGLTLNSLNVSALAFPGSVGGTGCRFGGESACSFPALADKVEVCVKDSRLEEWISTGSPARVLAGYQRSGVPPPSELALIKWRDSVAGPAQILEDITRFRAAGIPLGWALLDNPWETCVGSLAFDRTRFPDPAGLIRQVHALGAKFMLWVSPKILCNPGYPPTTLLGDPAKQVELDLRNTEVVRAYQAKLSKLVALGIDGVKADRADEVDLEAIDEGFQNTYPQLYQGAVMGALPKGAGAIFQAASSGSEEIVPGLWAGDQDSSFAGLQQAIQSGLSAAMSGFFSWGSDVGGYRALAGAPLTAELFARWAQFGAVSPIMEVGGQGANATPWTLGPAAMAALRDAAILHYELFPLQYGLLQRHQPVLRPLGYAYPDDPQAWNAQFEMLVGPDLLAAPVIGGGTTPSVYLPAGPWIDLYTGEVATSGASFTRPTPLDQLPLYVREGAVVSFNLRTATGSWWGVNEQTHPGRAGFLATNFTRLALTAQPHDVQIFVPSPDRPLRVTIGGHAVPWTWNAGPLPGAVVRVHGPTVRGEIVLSRT